MSAPLVHPLLTEWRVPHAFGTRGAALPSALARPKQVHGRAVARLDASGVVRPPEADAIVADRTGACVGVVTADCVPVLLASADGARVAAVHAGWRGLAGGVIEAALDALARDGVPARSLRAVIGPCIRACCYEIDAPVEDAMRSAFGAACARDALTPTRPGHHRLDLVALTRVALARGGVPEHGIGAVPDACTRCDAVRFHSYRRDGPRAGRLVHWVQVRGDRVDTPHPSA